jgi:alpha-glucoside transport system substrate-binding protein
VVVVWSGTEREVFRYALNKFERQYDAEIDLLSAGDGIGALLRSRIEAGHPPDVAVLPDPGLLKELLHKHKSSLVHLTGTPGADTLSSWPGELLIDQGALFGVWVKVTHKSVFWCRDEFPADRVITLEVLVNKLTGLAIQGRRPLSIGAADGWVLTDWFENALLAVDPDTYEGLAGEAEASSWDSSAVKRALTWLGRIWGIPKVFADGPDQALITQYDEAALRTFVDHHDDAAVTFGGDYTALLLAPYQCEGLAPPHLASFRFPPEVGGSRRPLLVGGDAAVLLRRPGDEPHGKARALVQWLAGSEAARELAGRGFLTPRDWDSQSDDQTQTRCRWPSRRLGSDLPDRLADLATELRKQSSWFDLSDRLQHGLARSDGQGLAGILQKFFAEVAERGDGSVDGDDRVRSAVNAAQRRMVKVAGES